MGQPFADGLVVKPGITSRLQREGFGFKGGLEKAHGIIFRRTRNVVSGARGEDAGSLNFVQPLHLKAHESPDQSIPVPHHQSRITFICKDEDSFLREGLFRNNIRAKGRDMSPFQGADLSARAFIFMKPRKQWKSLSDKVKSRKRVCFGRRVSGKRHLK
jgi:hypothetical protein